MATHDERSGIERAADEGGSSLLAEVLHFLRREKKWWLVPILVAVALLGVLALLAATGAAPFIYTLF
jgi:hypothetical protein